MIRVAGLGRPRAISKQGKADIRVMLNCQGKVGSHEL